MKSSVRVCVHRRSSEWKSPVNHGSQALFSIVSGTWISKLIKLDQYLNGHERE